MIADKLIPSFYLIQLSDNAIDLIIPNEYNIKTIAVSSHEFESDITATIRLQTSIDNIKSTLGISELPTITAFNPEFFPNVAELDLSPEQVNQLEEAQLSADLSMEQFLEQGNIPVVMNSNFDSVGAFIESRWLVNTEQLKQPILGRVAVSPQQYLIHKSVQQLHRHESIDRSNKLIQIH